MVFFIFPHFAPYPFKGLSSGPSEQSLVAGEGFDPPTFTV